MDHLDLGQDRGHVILSSRLVGGRQQLGTHRGRALAGSQKCCQALLRVDHVPQSIGAEEQLVSGTEAGERDDVDLDGRLEAEAAVEQVAVRVVMDLCGRDLALPVQGAGHGMVLGQLPERAVAPQVGPAVAHVRQGGAVSLDDG
jgi:hypothetical protein